MSKLKPRTPTPPTVEYFKPGAYCMNCTRGMLGGEELRRAAIGRPGVLYDICLDCDEGEITERDNLFASPRSSGWNGVGEGNRGSRKRG
jgi:hypothetical protein